MAVVAISCISTNVSLVTLRSAEENRSSRERGSLYAPCFPASAAGDTPEAILAAFPSLKAEEEGPVGWFSADIRRVLGD